MGERVGSGATIVINGTQDDSTLEIDNTFRHSRRRRNVEGKVREIVPYLMVTLDNAQKCFADVDREISEYHDKNLSLFFCIY